VNYDPGMRGTPIVLTAAVALAISGTSAVARADPGPVSCAYTLSPPQVVQLSGANVVTATLSPAACDEAVTYLSVACVQLQGSDRPEQCAQAVGILPAQIFFQPYRPGATYVATGRGCANKGNPPQPLCQTAGPVTATL
jgi:hypothetical protein